MKYTTTLFNNYYYALKTYEKSSVTNKALVEKIKSRITMFKAYTGIPERRLILSLLDYGLSFSPSIDDESRKDLRDKALIIENPHEVELEDNELTAKRIHGALKELRMHTGTMQQNLCLTILKFAVDKDPRFDFVRKITNPKTSSQKS